MKKRSRPWRIVMMTGVVAAGLGLLVVPAVAKFLAAVEVTGQTECWDEDGLPIGCAATGQDGDIQAGVPFPTPRFTDHGNGTVTDNLTGLIWLKDASCTGAPRGRTWGEALETVARLNAGVDFSCTDYASGKLKDWRLPNIKELQSLVDLGVDLVDADRVAHPALPDGHPFGKTVGRPDLFYWSSTTQQDEAYKAWGVDMDEGKTLPHFKNTAFKVTCLSCGLPNAPDNCPLTMEASFGVWPVRGPDRGSWPAPVEVTGQTQCWDPGDAECPIAEIKCKKATGQDGALRAGEPPPTPRFDDIGDGTVRDNQTSLVWLKDMDCLERMPWKEALAAVAALNAGEAPQCHVASTLRDWRLPNVKELQSLIDFGHSEPALPGGHRFKPVRSAIYHSSTTRVTRPDDAWFVSLRIGITLADPAEGNPALPSEGCVPSQFAHGKCATKYEDRRVWAVRGGRLGSTSAP